MQSPTVSSSSQRNLCIGRVLSGLAVLFLLFDAITKLMRVASVVEAIAQLGYPEGTVLGIGLILLVCTVLYVIPQTAVVGAILLTGYLGGAVASQVRVENPLFSHVLFPVYFGAVIWGGLLLRDARLGTLLRSPTSAVRSAQPREQGPTFETPARSRCS